MTEKSLDLTQPQPGEWVFVGEMTMQTLSEKAAELQKVWPTTGRWQMNFTQCQKIDSAGLAFMIECIRHAKALQLTLHFLHLPERIIQLAKVQGVYSLIQPYQTETLTS